MKFISHCSSCLPGRRPLAAVLVLWVTACASPEVVPPSEDELNRVSQALLEHAIYTDTLLRECSAVGPEVKVYSADLASRWQSLHGKALAGADAHYRQHLRAETIEYRGQPLALSAIRFAHRIQKRANEELRLHARSDNNRRIVCDRRLEALEQNLDARPYVSSERDRRALAELEQGADPGLTLSQVPTLAGAVPPEQDPGRSYRKIETQMNRQCANAELVVIDTDWPYEAYGAYCQGDALALVECEWGQCRER